MRDAVGCGRTAGNIGHHRQAKSKAFSASWSARWRVTPAAKPSYS